MLPDSDLHWSMTSLQLPRPEQPKLNFCNSKRPAAAKKWLGKLPLTRVSSTSSALYSALPELATLKASPSNRMEIAELFRPVVHQNIDGLARIYTSQSVNLSEESHKIGVISQSLQRHLTQAYCQVVADLIREKPQGTFKSSERALATKAVHRAISGLGRQFIRCAQTYNQVSHYFWSQLNALFRIALQLQVADERIEDPLRPKARHNSIEEEYRRILVMSLAKLNQLRQLDIAAVYEQLEAWSDKVRLIESSAINHATFIVYLDSNEGPHFIDPEKDDEIHSLSIGLSVEGLLDELKREQHKIDNGEPTSLLAHTITHLQQSLSERQFRGSRRESCSRTVKVGIGLISAHFYLSGESLFPEFCRNLRPSSRFSAQDSYDDWDSQGDQSPATQKNSPYPLFALNVVDMSAEGLCLHWPNDLPVSLKSGEVVFLASGISSGQLGVIRWIKRFESYSHLGIQILARNPTPAAIARDGDDDLVDSLPVYMRAFTWSPMGVQSNSANPDLLTATLPFKSEDKILFMDRRRTGKMVLTSIKLSTCCINVFATRFTGNGKQGEDNSETPVANHQPIHREFTDDW